MIQLLINWCSSWLVIYFSLIFCCEILFCSSKEKPTLGYVLQAMFNKIIWISALVCLFVITSSMSGSKQCSSMGWKLFDLWPWLSLLVQKLDLSSDHLKAILVAEIFSVMVSRSGTRIKTRKRNIAVPLDTATFADAVVQIYNEHKGDLVCQRFLIVFSIMSILF